MRSLKSLTGSRFVSVEDALKELEGIPAPVVPVNEEAKKKEMKARAKKPSAIFSDSEFLRFDNISCYAADGHVTEHYDVLHVRKDIFRDGPEQINRTPYAHALYCEGNALFLPSFSLTCNLLAYAFVRKDDSSYRSFLEQYKDKGNGNGWHAQNTVINYGSSVVIHYPSAVDFDQSQGVNVSQKRIALSFVKDSLEDALLKDALRDPGAERYVQQLTG